MSSALPDGIPPADALQRTLRHRRAGHAVMAECLRRVEEHASDDAGLPAQAVSWWLGAVGERAVGLELALLPPEWAVLHSIPVGTGGTDIDHLVIGPGGVFVLNTKAHRGANVRVGEVGVQVGGSPLLPYQRDLQHRTDRVQRALAADLGSLPVVQPLLVFVEPNRLRRVGPQGVASCTAAELVPTLLAAPAVLSPDLVAAVVARAERPDTWGAPASAALEADPTSRFLALPSRPAASGAARPVAAVAAPGSLLGQMVRTGAAIAATYLGVWALISVLTALLHR
jgi:hypothetical protein